MDVEYYYPSAHRKKCFVWKHKVHVIDPGIRLRSARRHWPAAAFAPERRRGPPIAPDRALVLAPRTASRLVPDSLASVFLTSVNAVVNFGAGKHTFYL